MQSRAHRLRRRASLFEALEDRRVMATDVQLVADIDLGDSRSNRSPHDLTVAGGAVFLAGVKATTGEELFISDAAGTRLVKDIDIGIESSWIRDLTANGSTLFFTANDGIHGRELWKSDGTTQGTVMVKDIRGGGQGSGASQLTNVNGTIFFAADDGTGVRLWKSDGTEAGTVRVSDQGELPTELTAVSGQVFFAANDFSGGRALWKSDGTPTGTQLVADFNDGASNLYQFTNVAGTLYFESRAGAHEGLWKSDGTPAGTKYLKDLDIADPGDPNTFTSFDGKLFFSIEASGHDELWSSDGTAAGTVAVRQFPSLPVNLTPVGANLFFAQGGGLWKTDGTAPGTVKLAGLAPSALANFNGQLVFRGRTQSTGVELFTSDGTAAGTTLLKDLNPTSTNGVPNSSSPGQFVTAQSALYFVATDAVNGPELWTSDGTAAGTVLRQVDAGGPSSTPHTLVNLGSELLFAAGDRVWKTAPGSGVTQVDGLTNLFNDSARVGNITFFKAEGPEGRELWKQEAGQITLVKDIYPPLPYSNNNYSSDPHGLTNVGGTLFFAARTAETGEELWRSDGTAAGTVLVKDIVPGKVNYQSLSGSPQELVAFGGKLFFTADTPSAGRELWVSDGTEGGTTLFRDLRVGVGSSDPRSLTVAGGQLFFTAVNGKGRELWVTDGTSAGTHLVEDIRPGAEGSKPQHLTAVGSRLYFTADDGSSGAELWASDGTATGTAQITDLQPGETGSSPTQLTNMNGTLFFNASDGASGHELWRTNGTAQSTVLVKDLFAGAVGSKPHSFAVLNGALFFSANNGTSGEELFVTDGTAAGTRLAADIAQPGGSAPSLLTVAGDTLYLSADNGVVGREVFRLVNAAPALSNVSGSVGYTLNGPAVVLASSAQVTDADNAAFRGGKLTVAITSGADTENRLEFTGGAFSLAANNDVLRNGVVIGRRNANGGVGTTPLQISFNAAATTSIVQELVRAIRFRTVSGTSTAQRQVTFELNDGDGGTSGQQIKTVNVS